MRSLQLHEGVTATEKLLYLKKEKKKKRFMVQNVEAAEKFKGKTTK